MAAKVATPKQTGGGGFNYEDKVGAYFLLCMLLNQHPFNVEVGLIERIDSQKSAGGWVFDDFVVKLNSHGQTRQVGVSVKSNQQFSENIIYGAPLKNLWEQNLSLNGRIFNAGSDYCCIVQPPLHGDMAVDLNTLIDLAIHQQPEDLDHNIKTPGYGSKEKLELYKSFACPDELAKQFSGKQLLPGQVLSRFLFLNFDFENVASKSENELLRLASEALVLRNPDDSSRLYEKLQQICKDLRPVGGYVDLNSLVNTLKYDFELKQFPSFTGDLEKIADTTRLGLSILKTKIGNSFSIDRSDELKGINEHFSTRDICCITSPSGYGKTALAKLYVATQQDENAILWLNASHFEAEIQSTLGLQHPLNQIITANTQGKVLIVIDGLERFYTDRQIQHLAMLLKSLVPVKGAFKILLTCVTEDLDGVLQGLYGYGITKLDFSNQLIENKKIDFPSLSAHFPNMADLLRSRELRLFLVNIKILDALSFTMTKSNAAEFPKDQVAESEIIDFLWKKQVETGDQGKLYGNVAKSIAQTQGNTLRMAVSTAAIDPATAAGLTALIGLGIVYEREDYLYFQHDLYGDWARYKVIRSHTHEIKSFLLTLDIGSPLWTKAIRQYGIYLLELKSEDQGWLNLYLQFDETSAHEKIIKNILLESIIFGTNTRANLNTLSEPLLANRSELLTRMLVVFLIKATSVNPGVLEIAKTLKSYSSTEVTVLNRIPLYIYWPPVLEFIYRHREQLIKDDYAHCARISRDWLMFTPAGTLCRKQMAEMAIILASEAFDHKNHFYGENKQFKERAFEGLLQGYSELPESASQLILKLSQRVRPPESEKSKDNDMPVGRSFRFREAQKWPHGPFKHIDDTFEDVCLSGHSLAALFTENPALANEVLLAILIKPPANDYHEHGLREEFDLNVPRQWYPPFYRKGPFLDLLNIDHLAALDGIIKLVDFATGQWRSLFNEEDQAPFVELNVDGISKKYYGDHSVYLWYRDIGAPPHSLVSILMAVERFLYNAHERPDIQRDCIKFILKQSESLAFIGMLVSTGKAFPMLFTDILLPCLEVQDFYIWEKHNITSFHLEQYGIMQLPASQREEANNWNKEIHRINPLDDLMINQLLNAPVFEPIYEKITASWEDNFSKVRNNKGFDIYKDRMLSFFQKKNYVLKPYKEGIQYYDYVEPEELKARMAPIREGYDAKQIRPSAFTVYQVLEKNQQPSLEELRSLWDLVEKLKKRKVKDLFNHLETPLSSILGSYIIYLKHKEIWITLHPEYYDIIFAYTKSIFERIDDENITVTNYSVQYDWNNFAPQLVAYLYKEKDSLLVRSWITLICTNFHVESVGFMFLLCSKILGWHHPLFIRLQNYVLSLAAVGRTGHFPATNGGAEQSNSCNNKFINDEVLEVPEYWEKHRVQDIRKSKGRKLRAWEEQDDDQMLMPGLNLSLLHAAYKHLPSQNLPDSIEERAQIIFIWKQAFDQVIYQFGDRDTLQNEIDEFPGDFDLWVIKMVPALLGETSVENFFQDFAEPLLNFGYLTPEWNDLYCSYILLTNLDKRDRYDMILPRWSQIVTFCLNNDNWRHKGNKRDRYLLLSLFLLKPEYNVWNDDYSDFTTRASQIFVDFFNRKSLTPQVVKALCKFACSISGKQFLKQTMNILDLAVTFFVSMSKVPIPDGAVRKQFYAIDQLGSLLSRSWESSQVAIRSDEEMFNSYKNLVVFLVSIHDPVGIELQGLLLTG